MAVQEGTIGAEILYTVKNPDGSPKDISLATGLKYHILKPDGTTIIVTPVFDTDGEDGLLSFVTTTAAQLTPAGRYFVQPEFVMGLFNGRTSKASFPVFRNI